jgi:SAM-dependent methyltransferase
MRLYPEFFQRLDERPDAVFYAEPRLATHLGAAASGAVRGLYDRLLKGGDVLDLMASYRSHLPEGFLRVTGLGLNEVEMKGNPALTDYLIRDINQEPLLPFGDASFDGAVCTASVQYLTRPLEVFAEVGRCLKPGAPFVVSYSSRMFPTKAVLAWRGSDEAAHIRLVEHYFRASGGFGQVATEDLSAPGGEPLYASWGIRQD